MAQRVNSKKNTKKGEKKDFKNQSFKMRGTLEKWDTFGTDDEHAWFTIAEETNGTKYSIKVFNPSEKFIDVLNNAENVEVHFNISYNKYNGNIGLVLIAHDIFSID